MMAFLAMIAVAPLFIDLLDSLGGRNEESAVARKKKDGSGRKMKQVLGPVHDGLNFAC
jgi:hypothetical protein